MEKFDATYYRDFNKECNRLSDKDLKVHYETIGKQCNEVFKKYNYTITNYFKNHNVVDWSARQNIYKFKEKEQLVSKYPRRFYICNKDCFDVYYDGFDCQYYKKKYFNGVEISDYEMMKHHAIFGGKNAINDKLKVVIYTPEFDINCGGIVALHNMAKTLNDMNINTKLYVFNGITYNNTFCRKFAHIDEIDENTIVIYPEIVSGNPLGASKVVRWILLDLGIEMSADHWKNWGENDLVYYWEPKNKVKQLSLPWYNPIFRNNTSCSRNKTCFLIKKGRLIHKNLKQIHQSDSICIDNIKDLLCLKDLFNQCKYFYSYDPNSAFVIFAASCGCVPIIYPISGISSEEYFKTRIYNYNGNIYKKGIVYGTDSKDLSKALNEVLELGNYYEQMFELYKSTVIDFVTELSMFDKLTNTVKNTYI